MRNLPRPAYIMSEPHLTGWRIVLGYETLAQAQAAHSVLSDGPLSRQDGPSSDNGTNTNTGLSALDPDHKGGKT